MRQLFRELKRRNVYKVAVTYAVVAFVTLQAAELVFPATTLEGLYDKLVVLAFVGFPIALVLAWAFEMTPEGVRRTSEGEDAEAAASAGSPSRLAVQALVGLGLVAAAVAGGWYLTGGGGETEPRSGERSIAVLPFEALGKEEPGTFTEGMHDDLLTRLSNVSGLKVISRTSVQQYRDTDKTTADIARELGVRWVLEGGVQEMGDQIQVNAQLIDPRTDTHAWSDSYRRDLTASDLFALQSEITKKIARSLEAELTASEAERVERQPTEDLEAYRLYVQGRSALNTRTSEGMRDAVDYFRRAIRQDSAYALAWSGLSDAVGLYPGYGPDSVPADLPDQELAARRALELGPDLAEAHASMGLVHFQRANGPAVLRELKRAVELKPSYAQAHHWLGELLFNLGRPDAAREHVALAVELDPRHFAARAVLIDILLADGEVERAWTHLRQLSADQPRYAWNKGKLLYHAEQWDTLASLSRRQLAQGDVPERWRLRLGRAEVGRGDTAAARAQLAAIRENVEPGPSRFLWEGLLHAALGQADSAFSAWRRADEELDHGDWTGATRLLRYRYPDILGPLRDDPRFRSLLERLNQTWGLNPDGSLPDSVDVSFSTEGEANG